jgi:hypothetical protein
MRRWFNIVCFLLLVSPAIPATANDLKYDRYVNVRFAFGISYPTGVLIPQGEADNGDGQKFVSKDGKTVMLAYGYNNPDPEDYTLRNVFRDELTGSKEGSRGRVVKYKVSKKTWFVVSGIDRDTVFYTKVIYKADEYQFINFRITYPNSQREFYDPIVSTISDSMKILPGPFMEGQTKKVK